jgi:lipopolysaccharide assembly protein A
VPTDVVTFIFAEIAAAAQANREIVAHVQSVPRHHPFQQSHASAFAGDRCTGECAVRFVYIALIVAFTALILLFKFQNLDMVTVSLFSASFTLPLSVLVLLIYLLGMCTGGFVLTLLRSWIHGASRRR